jgi:hypothetical protein
VKVGGDLLLAYRDPRGLAAVLVPASVYEPHLDASDRLTQVGFVKQLMA